METNTVNGVLKVKRLAPDEYEKLRNVEEGYVPDPAHSIVIVAELDEKIVGRAMLIRPFHVEGTWLDHSIRKGTVGIRMFRLLEEEVKKIGMTKIFSYSQSDEVSGYLERMGYKKQDVTIWVKDVCR
jgi:hypothetical protein